MKIKLESATLGSKRSNELIRAGWVTHHLDGRVAYYVPRCIVCRRDATDRDDAGKEFCPTCAKMARNEAS